MKSLKITFLVLLLIQSGIIMSQTAVTDTSKSISLDEFVVSANKTIETKRSIAQQVQVIQARDIEGLQPQSTADLIANSGNVFVQKSQMGGGSPVIRGFEANRILLVIDGVRMNNIIYRAGHLQNIITVDNSSLDRVEVLFGPSSTIYGSDALGGVIHMYTRNPHFADPDQKQNLKVNAFTRFGTVNDEMTGHFDVNAGGKKFASLTSFTYSHFDHLKGGKNQNPFYTQSYGERPYYAERINNNDSLVKNSDRYLQVQSGFNQYDVLQKFAYKQNDHVTHGLNIQYSGSTDIPRYDRLTDPAGSGLRYAEWYYGPQKRLLGAYDLNIDNPSSFFQKIHAGISYQSIEESRHTRRFGNDNLQHRTENVNVIGANVDFNKVMSHHSIRFGLDAQYNNLKSKANEENIETGVSAPLDTRYPDGDNMMTHAALYFSHSWHVSEQLVLTDGLRAGMVSLHSTISENSFFNLPVTTVDQDNAVYSGSLGLIHSPADDLKLSLLLSTGFRAPNIDDLAKVFESSPGNVIVPNPDLGPEKTVTYEMGIAKIYENKTSWENSFFYTDFYDAIVTDEYQLNGSDSVLYDGTMSRVYANQNMGRAYLYGISSTIKSRYTENLFMSFGLNYTYGRIKTDSSDYPLDHIPPFLMRLQLSYKMEKFSASFFINYNGWKKLKDYYLNGEDNEQYATPDGMPAWFTTNLHASYDVHKLVSVQAGVDNIFDTQYRTFASGINAPGRNVFVAVRFHY